MLLEVDKKFPNFFFNEGIIKEEENVSNKIKESLKIGKKLENKWDDDNELISKINDCIKIEKNVIDIDILNEKILNLYMGKIKFMPEEKEINVFLQNIKQFGNIYNDVNNNSYYNNSINNNNNFNNFYYNFNNFNNNFNNNFMNFNNISR